MPEVTTPMLLLMAPVPPVKVGVSVTVAPNRGVVLLATRLVTTGAATMLAVKVPAGAETAAALVTVQLRVVVPTAPAVKVTWLVFVALVMAPEVMDQA